MRILPAVLWLFAIAAVLPAQGATNLVPRTVTVPVQSVPPGLPPTDLVPGPRPQGVRPQPDVLPPGPAGSPQPASPPLGFAQPIGTDSPGDFRVFSDTRVRPSGMTAGHFGWPPEPVAVIDRDIVAFTANNYAAGSIDSGRTWNLWNHVYTYSVFPYRDAGFNGDQRLVHAPARGLTAWVWQYAYDPVTSHTGAHRLAVCTSHDNLKQAWFSRYGDLTPQMFGVATDTWFDFPDVAVGDNFLYGFSRAFDAAGTAVDNILWRISLAELQSATANWNFTFYSAAQLGLNVVRLCQDTRDTLWAAMTFNSTTLRLYWWPETGNLSFEPKTMAPIAQFPTAGNNWGAGPDNRPWLNRSDTRVLGAARGNGEVVFMFMSAPTINRPQPYVRAMRIAIPSRAVTAQEDLWSLDHAVAYPAVAANTLGHFGVTLTAGGGTLFPNAYAFIVDNYEPGFASHAVSQITLGNSGPATNRWGDYVGVALHPYSGQTWIGTGFCLMNGPNWTDVENHVFWFGRELYEPAWTAVNVTSNLPSGGVDVGINQADRNGNLGGVTPLVRSYPPGQGLRLRAPVGTTIGTSAWVFDRWAWNGVPQAAGNPVLDINDLSIASTFEARYLPAIPLTITSLPLTGVPMQNLPPDLGSVQGGTTDYTVAYLANTNVTVTAPLRHTLSGGSTFLFNLWNVNGNPGTPGVNTVTVNVGTAGATLIASYSALGTLSVTSLPSPGAAITVTPPDENNLGNGVTPFQRSYRNSTWLQLTAPSTLGSESFSHWEVGGQLQPAGLRTASFPFLYTTQAVAVYGASVLNGVYWAEITPALSPPARTAPALGYDAQRRRTVLFGGGQGGNVNLGDTWEHDGSAWLQRTPAASPAARRLCAMAYDPVRNRCVLFGGNTNATTYGDTWLWDGSNWLQAAPANSPSARSGHALVFQNHRGRILLFSGATSLTDTWEWDGGNWLQAAPANSPTGRTQYGLAYDSARQRTVLAGGLLPGGTRARDTWEWDGTSWTQRVATAPWSARMAVGMAFDPMRARTVMFGGSARLFNTTILVDETWEWDGTTWTQRTPGFMPTPRWQQTMVWDAGRGRAVLFGGNDGTVNLADTWTYSSYCDVTGPGHPGGGLACACTTPPVIGGTLCIRYDSPLGVGFTLFGFAPPASPPFPAAPPAFCAAGSGFAYPVLATHLALGNPASTCIGLPNNPVYVGLGLVVQGACLDTGNCLRLSDGVVATVHAP